MIIICIRSELLLIKSGSQGITRGRSKYKGREKGGRSDERRRNNRKRSEEKASEER